MALDWKLVFDHAEHLAGTYVAGLTMWPLVKRHLVNLHKRLSRVERHLEFEPTTPVPGFGILPALLGNGTGRREDDR